MDLKEIEANSSFLRGCSRRRYYVTTAAIFLGNIALGVGLNAYSPVVSDFATKYGKEVEEISYVFTVSTISYLIGALLTSFIYNFISRQLGVVVFLCGISTALYVTPHCPSLNALFATGALLGLCSGAYDASQVVWIMEMWQAESGPFILAQHFFFALGAMIPGLVMAPFLSSTSSAADSAANPQHVSQTWIPFTCLAVAVTLTAIFQLSLLIFKPYSPPPPEDREGSTIIGTPSSSSSHHMHRWAKHLKIKLIVLSAIFLGFYQGMEMSSAQFISTFGQFGDHDMSESEGSLLYTAQMSAYTIGRGVGIFAILKIPPHFILLLNTTIVIIANAVLLLSNSAAWVLWLGASLLGLGFSTTYPSFCAYIERHLVFTNAIGSLMLVSGSSVGSIYPVIIGQQIKDNPIVLTYVNFFSVGLMSIAFAFVLKLTLRRRK